MARTHPPANVNNVLWTEIVALSYCRGAKVRETDQAGTTDYYFAAPLQTDGLMTIGAGKEQDVPGPFVPGDVICSLKTEIGSTTFDVIEY